MERIWKPLGFLLLSVHWFNPLMWLSYIFLCKDIEAACDEKVISQMDKSTSNSMWGLVDGAEYILQTEDSFKKIMESDSDVETVDESDSVQSSEYKGVETKLFEKCPASTG